MLLKVEKQCEKRICWISFLILDKDLHKTSQIEIMKCFAELGYQASILGMYSKKKFKLNIKNVNVIPIPIRDASSFAMFAYTLLLFMYLPFYFARTKIDYAIVEPQGPLFFSLFPIRLFPKAVRPKIVLDIRSTPVDGTQTGRLIFNTGVHVSKKFFDGITIITPMMRAEVCNQFQIDPKTMGVWPSGVSTGIFDPEKYDKVTLKKSFGLDGKFIVLYHGSVGASYEQVDSRGIVESIKSIKLLKDQHSNVVLYILGDSRSFQILKKLMTEYNVEDRVILHDKVPYEEVPKYIAMSDVGLIPFNLPIWRNQCPLKLLEYSSMGKATIVTDIPAHRYILGDCKSAIFIQANTSEEIAKAISKAQDNLDGLEDGGAYERALTEERYSWRRVATEFERYLFGLTKQRYDGKVSCISSKPHRIVGAFPIETYPMEDTSKTPANGS